ncbi:MAG: molybdopterin-guanine dinucleotide biosynthesis protein B [endosymbiont of Galathealinum brachiosum]|uniref:Molybdopterin-guanine dinucleotide biosynthesis protein B n=1 Tax=endosymbiont of Galathealinum brachiosum TaxID=2200906 RepID=A0A370DIZ2_9GAMM|nr:MAG: molybdopterin-guanine dinucleotide biosynthesis protein B [endosymbiont of Galathealinum brachiosum]
MSNQREKISYEKPLLGFAAFSGTGKTTLLLKLIPELKQRGLRIAVIKHAHHNFDMDTPGKDSYELRKAGAVPMLICSSKRTVITIENETEADPTLQQMLTHIPADSIDMILVEGFKKWPFDKIELHRESTGKPLMYPDDDKIIAIAHDDKTPLKDTNLPQLDINNVNAIADFVIQYHQQHGS